LLLRDKKVVGVFVRFRASLQQIIHVPFALVSLLYHVTPALANREIIQQL
jgi:hypothetical protein